MKFAPVLLFRYSALTFNGYRIHYDYPDATEAEAYSGLVVHSPMQATRMLNLAATLFTTSAVKMSYRGVSPLICGRPLAVQAEWQDATMLALKTIASTGATAMTAQASLMV